MRASQLVRAATASTPSASQLVKQALRASGPLTTHSLHSTLHTSYAPLPVPLPSSSSPSSSSSSSSSSRPPSPFARIPKPKPSADPSVKPPPAGSWSVSYLKKRVLASLQARGEVVKITRGQWEDKAGVSSSAASTAASVVEGVVAAVTGSGKGKGGKGKASQAKKEEQEHVWVEKEQWKEVRERWAAAKGKEEKALASRVGAKASEVEAELRSEYGLEGGARA